MRPRICCTRPYEVCFQNMTAGLWLWSEAKICRCQQRLHLFTSQCYDATGYSTLTLRLLGWPHPHLLDRARLFIICVLITTASLFPRCDEQHSKYCALLGVQRIQGADHSTRSPFPPLHFITLVVLGVALSHHRSQRHKVSSFNILYNQLYS